ncbi:Spy/CpxP family protein refolding chaperone [Psychrobacter sp. 1U1]|uniref:Spy/CpxP family protein refolding chaperone n=1 Tax=Psychrobacter sp. 1U1 TaxID=3453576 RepID=UPI003F48501D
MKKLLMGSVLAMSSVFTVTACTSVNATTDTAPTTSKMQHHKAGVKGGMHKGGMRGPMSQLDLTTTQQAQIKAIMQEKHGERMQNREAMLAILTAEQRAQLETLKSERQAKGHRRSHNKGGKNSPLSELNLTATQQAQIATIRQNNSGNRMQNHSAIIQVLTAEQRQKLEAIKADRMAKGHKGLERQKMQN